jgi:Ca-activated chloride channel family protein
MYFLAPEFLWLLLIVPGLVLLYLWLMQRKKKLALRYASLAIVKQAMAGDPSWRRHLPPALLLAAIGLALLASSSPTVWWHRKRPPRPSWQNCRLTLRSAS